MYLIIFKTFSFTLSNNQFQKYSLNTYGAGTRTGTITFQKSEPEPEKIVTLPQHCKIPVTQQHIPEELLPKMK